MINPVHLEESYKEFSQDLQKWVPDGIISVNLSLLNELGLLNNAYFEQAAPDNISHYFHVIETADKVTLFNEQFAIWIVPRSEDPVSSTLTFIALIQNSKPHLEIVFANAGVYNTPK